MTTIKTENNLILTRTEFWIFAVLLAALVALTGYDAGKDAMMEILSMNQMGCD